VAFATAQSTVAFQDSLLQTLSTPVGSALGLAFAKLGFSLSDWKKTSGSKLLTELLAGFDIRRVCRGEFIIRLKQLTGCCFVVSHKCGIIVTFGKQCFDHLVLIKILVVDLVYLVIHVT